MRLKSLSLVTKTLSPKVFSYPVALGINDFTYMAMHSSKHNLIEPGLTPSYANGRLVSLVKDDGTDNTYFTYDDGTGQRQ